MPENNMKGKIFNAQEVATITLPSSNSHSPTWGDVFDAIRNQKNMSKPEPKIDIKEERVDLASIWKPESEWRKKMIKMLKQYLSLRGVLCSIHVHNFKKIDKNVNHDFLECSCGKRKFKCGYWSLVDQPIREIISYWVEGKITQQESWSQILEWKKQKNGSIW